MNDFYNKKILVIQTAFLGDVILSTPVVREINKIFRYSQIDVLTRPDTQIVFKYNPYVNKTLVFDKKGKRKKLASFIELVKLFREIEYDLAISIQSSFTSAMLMVLGKIHSIVKPSYFGPSVKMKKRNEYLISFHRKAIMWSGLRQDRSGKLSDGSKNITFHWHGCLRMRILAWYSSVAKRNENYAMKSSPNPGRMPSTWLVI